MSNELPEMEKAPAPEAVTDKDMTRTNELKVVENSFMKTFMVRAHELKEKITKIDRTTKSFIIVFVIFALIFGGFTYFKGVFIAATINGSPISRLSVIRELEKQGGKNVLDTIITKKLIQDEIKKQGVVVASADIDAEIKKVETQISMQGGTLEQALAGQGMTMADFQEQILINKALEEILADKIKVSDEEIDQYLSTNQMQTTTGVSSDDLKNQAREQLSGNKFSTEATQWVSDLKTKASINYYVPYE